MPKVQVVYASRHGATAGIADRVAAVLRAQGVDVVETDAAFAPEAGGFDAYIVGSGIYMGSWLKEAVEYLERNLMTLTTRPTWLFSSGPLPGSTKDEAGKDSRELALGPEHGPGSAGRQRIETLGDVIGVQDHRIFLGAYDPDDAPRTLAERVVRILPGSRGILPEGDFREWAAIEAWARDIAAELAAPVPVG
jgi:menaquinone-dependent protoporphyrinogen oxidase